MGYIRIVSTYISKLEFIDMNSSHNNKTVFGGNLQMPEYKGLQSFPGRYRKYLDFIAKVLVKLKTDRPDRSGLLNWMKNKYKLTSASSARSYLQNILALGLIVDRQDGLYPSGIGEKFLENKKERQEIIFEALVSSFAGFQEIVVFLYDKNEASIGELHEMLEKSFAFHWKTTSQTSRRLSWLKALGYAETVSKRAVLTVEGRKAAARLLSL